MNESEKASTKDFSAIRNLWNTLQSDKAVTNNSNTEEDEDELAGRRQLSMTISQTLRTKQLLINFQGGQPVLSLRPPLDLINFPTIPRPRWPVECEVTDDTIQHIEWDPPEPEPFYQPTRNERTYMSVGQEMGQVVYCSDPATKRPYFSGSHAGGSKGLKKSTTSHVSHTDATLEFESRFESGNLQKAVQVGVYDYQLTLRKDMYTLKHTQWFYFRVRNMKPGVTYRFTIINLMKSSSLYSQGMRPLLYSERAAQEKCVGWQRAGSNIRYYRSYGENVNENSDSITLYSLTWTLEFPYDSDTCYLAHCYPYTYSHLQRYLRRVSSNPAVASYCKVRILCRSLAGNAVYVVTITSRGAGRQEGKDKKAVVVTARVHPGETNGSWMMEGFLDFLLGDSDDARLLRDNFVFKVVPMLNPDGVVVGNYRCSLAGRDLNRNYKTLLRDSFPCVWHTRNMVERLKDEMDVVLYCDFHGHNRKNNAFMYGCNNRGDTSLKLHERVFPLMMSKNASNKFSFKSCKFRVQRNKEGTGRIVMWKMGIKNSYTMEATFGGSTLDDRKGTHFTTRDLKSLGYYFCDTLLDFCDPDPAKVSYCLTQLTAMLKKEIRERIGKDVDTDCHISVSDLETSTSGSNSSDSDGLPVHLLHQSQSVPPEETQLKKKKKRLKSRKERNRLQRERDNAQSKDLHSDNDLKDSIKKKSVDRRKWELNWLRKTGVLPPTTNTGEVSQVTLWQGCEPVKGVYEECLRTSYLHQKEKVAVSPPSGDSVTDRRWRCSPQMLHLSAILPPPTDFLDSNERLIRQPVYSAFKLCRELPPAITAPCRLVPTTVPTKCLRTISSANKSRGRHNLRGRNSLWYVGHYAGSEDSSTEKTKTTCRNENLQLSEVNLSKMTCEVFGEQIQRACTPETTQRGSESYKNVLEPVPKGKKMYSL